MNGYAIRRNTVSKWDYRSGNEPLKVHVSRGDASEVDGVYHSVTIEEHVMEWKNAHHIHNWFVKNVLKDYPSREKALIGMDKLRELLLVCEKVLSSSQLVPETMFASALDRYPSPDSEALRNPGKVIKNVNVAHQLLPDGTGYSGDRPLYGEEYLKAVEETRNWVLRMIADRREGKRGELYYVAL